MFTGLVEAIGEVHAIKEASPGRRITIATPVARQLAIGESIAVDGVCLTVVRRTSRAFDADVAPETLRVTTLGAVTVGAGVNLEQPVKADARLGGHLVQGHVDATGRIARIVNEGGECYRVTISFPSRCATLVINKGSIAVDGISLTVASLDASRFDVQIIPHTWRSTTLGRKRAGDRVNLEFDMTGKYVARAIDAALRARTRRPR